ncbi:D-alanyl-lipoteichoic acid acyltransferase DltB (MBOAT superfamily) [Vibrio diazotrophicus]|uniref:Probable alginate O-acetylase n=1 Tax=Vibrio diazotrophicus TaxID=685 RepID=A0A329DTG9_VIBDI|nr:MBOAT family protein [Vibrio diazotrophicus]RAS52424.1 D-alanyl-lipoteichoic acid acyltransferase DltB (MBOAT superfamily) [Vibrio diazotrophicus]
MLFNTPQFIFAFLPIVFIVYFILNNINYAVVAKAWLVISSLFFYSYWNENYLVLFLFSLLANYSFGSLLNNNRNSRHNKKYRKSILFAGVLFNITLLGYYKYFNFIIENINELSFFNIYEESIILPLAISFFTFQQIAYLVDAYNYKCKEYDFLSYCLFVTFFPQLIAGPIVHHKEMMPQFSSETARKININNITLGVCIFGLGLFKKVIIADQFATWASQGFDNVSSMHMLDAWLASLSYTFQLYYDFSGYADMAIGAALLFNIKLPINFDSPYKALNIQDFWRRWHITLSRWLKDYIYIPLGGSRCSKLLNLRNLFLTAFISGIWHGAGWTFIIWGSLHGGAMIVHRLWTSAGIKLNKYLSWFITFNFVNIAWVFFRSNTVGDAKVFLWTMFGGKGYPKISTELLDMIAMLYRQPLTSYYLSATVSYLALPSIVLALLFTCSLKNSNFLSEDTLPSVRKCILLGIVGGLSITAMFSSKSSEFLYFNF